MKFNFLLLIILFVKYGAISQPVSCSWLNRSVGENDEKGNTIAKDNNGNVYVAGSFVSPNITLGSFSLINFTISGNPQEDIFIVKYNTIGNVVWAKSIGGSQYDVCTSIAIDSNGELLITGYFASNTISFDSFVLNKVGVVDVFVAKFDVNGNVIWAKSAGSNYSDWSNSIAIDINNNIYIAGSFDYGPITFGAFVLPQNSGDELFLVKYSSNGTVIWAKSAGGSGGAYINGITTDLNNNVFIGGDFGSSTINFGNIMLTNSGFSSQDGFIVKYDANGNPLWAKNGQCSGEDYLYGITADSDGSLYFTGCFDDPGINFGNIGLSYNGTQSYNIYVAKYDSLGNIVWAQGSENGGEGQGRSVAIDASGNTYLTGEFYTSNISFGGITSVFNGGSDVFLAKFDELGNPLWVKSYGGNSLDYGTSIVIENTESIYITGHYGSSSISFGNCTITNPDFSSEMFTVKLNVLTGILESSKNNFNFNLKPNPANEVINCNIINDSNSKVIIKILSLDGLLLYTNQIKNEKEFKIDISNLNSGFYIVEISNNREMMTQKLIKY